MRIVGRCLAGGSLWNRQFRESSSQHISAFSIFLVTRGTTCVTPFFPKRFGKAWIFYTVILMICHQFDHQFSRFFPSTMPYKLGETSANPSQSSLEAVDARIDASTKRGPFLRSWKDGAWCKVILEQWKIYLFDLFCKVEHLSEIAANHDLMGLKIVFPSLLIISISDLQKWLIDSRNPLHWICRVKPLIRIGTVFSNSQMCIAVMHTVENSCWMSDIPTGDQKRPCKTAAFWQWTIQFGDFWEADAKDLFIAWLRNVRPTFLYYIIII